MDRKIKFWQWPNILAVDAAAIAIAWYWVFSKEASLVAASVLGLSVWLTYVADRLFDASRRPKEKLLSHRHRFTKSRQKLLWAIWMLVLPINIALALTGLDATQLERGFILLALCLTYTALNQVLSKRFFPKELFVTIIFIGGTQVFLPQFANGLSLFALALLCLLNCLMIAKKEEAVDAGLEVRSLSFAIKNSMLNTLLALAILGALFSPHQLTLLPTAFCLTLLQLLRQRFETEHFRVLCDATLLFAPALYLFFGSGVFVR